MSEPLQLKERVSTSRGLSVEMPYDEAIAAVVALARSKGLNLPEGDWRLTCDSMFDGRTCRLWLQISQESSQIVSSPGPLLADAGDPEPWTPPATKDG